MGKIGDLFVRLGLKSDEYKKGMNDAKKETKTFGEGLKTIKAAAVAAWAAIGAAVIGFGKEMLKTTNAIGDAWARMTAGLTAGWKTFVQAVSNFDFNGFIGKFKEATAAAVQLQNALDAEFESSNSIKIQRALMSEELEELRILMRDQTKTLDERYKATQDYMRKITPIYEQEIRLAHELLDAWQGKWLAGTTLKDNAGTRNDLTKFLVDYGKDRELSSNIAKYLELEKDRVLGWGSILTNRGRANQKAVKIAEGKSNQHSQLTRWLQQYGQQNGYENFIGELAKVYENWRGDEDTKPLVDAIVNAGNSQAALNKETRQIQTLQNSILAAIQEERAKAEAEKAEVEKLRAEMNKDGGLAQVSNDLATQLDKLAAPELFTDEWTRGQTDNLEELKTKLQELGLAAQEVGKETAQEVGEAANTITLDFSQAIVGTLGNGLQAITDLMVGLDDANSTQVLAAFLQPLGETMKSMGALIMSAGLATAKLQLVLANPAGAVAAGAALMAMGAAVSSGISSMLSNMSSGGSGTSASYGGAAYATTPQNYESTLTVEVVGKLSGSDIVIAGKKTQESWRR